MPKWKWSQKIEDELTLLIKDWLKQQNKTQKDLKRSLDVDSERMPALIRSLQKDYSEGGMTKLAARLCSIEKEWASQINSAPKLTSSSNSDPFGQLDLLLEELKENCKN